MQSPEKIEKIYNTSDLILANEYLLYFKDENISVNVVYIGCATGQIEAEEDMFGTNYNIVLPDNSIDSAYNYTKRHPCVDEIGEGQVQLLFFRNRMENLAQESDWSFNIVYSKNMNIPSTIHKYQIYSITNIENIEDIRCYWEDGDDKEIKHIFEILAISAEEADQYSKNTTYGNHPITDAIKTGIFTSKISKIVDNNPIVDLERINQQAIQGWYELAAKLTGILYIEGQQFWCVYRFIYNIDIILNDRIVQPLPFSSTYNLEWLKKEWAKSNKCCLLRILIPFDAPMTVIEPPDKPVYMDRNSQYEIVLPAGILHRQHINTEPTGFIVGSYILEPWSYEECIKYINHYNTTNF